jgi:hypothetical protein
LLHEPREVLVEFPDTALAITRAGSEHLLGGFAGVDTEH